MFCVVAQSDNHILANELQSAISQNTDITEKFVRSELTREQLRAQLQDLKQTTGYVKDIPFVRLLLLTGLLKAQE